MIQTSFAKKIRYPGPGSQITPWSFKK